MDKLLNCKFPQSFTLILFLLLSLCGSGQTDFRPGYYITWENDTVYGLIDFRGEIRNSRFCIYKQNNNSESLRFAPNEIKSYRFIDDKYYISKEIELNDERTPIFLEILVDGITNLYYLRDTEQDMYFVEKADGTLYKLIREISTSYEQGKGTTVRESFNYVGFLKLAFVDCPEIQPKLNNAKLTHQSLIGLTQKYHNYVCDDEQCVIYEKKLPALKLQIAPIIGIGITTMDISKGFYSRFDYDPSISPTFGILLNAILPRTNNKISLQLEALVKKEDFYGTYNEYFELFVNATKVQPSLGIVYNFPKGKVRPTLSIGGFGSYLLNMDKKTIVTTENNVSTNENEPYVPIVNHFYGGYMQLGCNYHIFKNREAFSNVKVMHGTGVFNSTQERLVLKNTFKSIYFNVGFYLGKN